jgi:dolichol-phosphate mannosyltransferase
LTEPNFDDETKKEAVQILQTLAKRESLVKREIVDSKFEKHVAMLVSLGLVRRVMALEGMSYQITEKGSRFLDEYKDMYTNLTIHPSDVITRFAKDKVTVVVPVLNEADGICQVIEEIAAEGYENVLVVDGYSTDKTPHLAHAIGAKVVYQHGSGKAGAVKTAIETAQTPYMLFMDGDCTYDPKDIWRLLNHSEYYAHVIGARDRKHIPYVHRFGNWIISKTFSLLFGVRLSDVCSGMYLLETEEAKSYSLQEPGFQVEIELAAQSASRDSLAEVPISYRPRIGAKKLKTWRHGLGILLAAYRLARGYNPILLYSAFSGLSIIPAVVILTWVAMEQLTRGIWHSGVALVGVVFLMVAIQALTLASVSILLRHVEARLTKEMQKGKRRG